VNEKLIIRMTRPLEPFDASDPQIVQAAQALGVSVEKLEQIATREVGRVIAQAKDPQHGAQVTKILATIGVQVRVEADPVKTDPVKTEPVKTDPVKVVPQTVSPAMQQAITQPRSASKASSIEAAANSNFADQNAVNPNPTSPNPTSPNLTSPNPVPAVPAFAPIRSQAGAAAIAEARPAMAAAEVADDPFAPIQRSETMLESRHEIEDRHDQPQAIAAVEASAPGRRSSLRNRMIGAFLIPVLGLGIAIGAYIMVALPGVVTRSLESRAFAASYAAGRLMVKDAVQLPDMSALSNLNRSSRELLSSTQDAAFIAVLPEGSDPIISSELNLDSEATAVTLGEQLGTYSSNGGIGTFDAGGQTFTVAASPIQTASEGSTSLGTVVVALKRDAIASEVMRALVPFSIALLVALGATAALGFRLSGTLISPIMKATDLSNRISMGDLDLEVKAERNDEIGDLLGSLERMRVSLKMLLNQPT
jgi:HAMP domain-containing protein